MNIIGISGKQQAGKSTTARWLMGHILKEKLELVKEFGVNKEGQLLVTDENGDLGILDPKNHDFSFVRWANTTIFPTVRLFSLADSLKEVCMRLYGLSVEQCFGSDDDKNTKTLVKINNRYQTARKVMEIVGKKMREVDEDCFVRTTLSEIISYDSELSIIDDIRFPNEAEHVKKLGGKIIRLTADPNSATSRIETALDGYTDWDGVIENDKIGPVEQGQLAVNLLKEWGMI